MQTGRKKLDVGEKTPYLCTSEMQKRITIIINKEEPQAGSRN